MKCKNEGKPIKERKFKKEVKKMAKKTNFILSIAALIAFVLPWISIKIEFFGMKESESANGLNLINADLGFLFLVIPILTGLLIYLSATNKEMVANLGIKKIEMITGISILVLSVLTFAGFFTGGKEAMEQMSELADIGFGFGLYLSAVIGVLFILLGIGKLGETVDTVVEKFKK